MTTDELTALIHSSCSLAFNLPSGISLDDEDEPIRVTVTHNDEPIEDFELAKGDAHNDKLVVQKLFEEVDESDGGNYVITVDVGRQQYIHKLAVSIG